MLKIDFENQILALFDGYFWPFNKSHEKIKSIFVISTIIPSIWNVFIKFRWRDEILTVVKPKLTSVSNYPSKTPTILCMTTARQDFIPAKMDVKVPYSLQRETLQVREHPCIT